MQDKNKVNIAFGMRIQTLRNRLGISQEELSFRAGLNRTYVGDIERGEKNASVFTASKLAEGLGITLKELFDYGA